MKNTPFTETHIALGAKMYEFAGYNMPVEYSGIIDEHLTVCQSVGVFDVSHMGEIWVKGPKSFEFLQRVTTNDLSNLPIGKAQYSCLTNDNGGIIDDLLVYHYEADKYMLVVNASNVEKDWEWCVQNNKENVVLENASNKIAQLAVQGPKALSTLQRLTKIDLSKIPYYSFITGYIAGVEDVIISNTGYTGAGGFELYFYAEYSQKIWDAIFKSGDEFGIKPIGLGARDTLRLEMGFCLYGHELTEEITPLEAGLGWITKFVDGKNFIGKEILEEQKNKGVSKKLIGFELLDKGIPREGYEILNANSEVVGSVTSGTISPTRKVGIGLAYVKPEYAEVGAKLFVQIRNKTLQIDVVKPPFRK